MFNFLTVILFVAFGVGLFYCAPVIIRDGIATINEFFGEGLKNDNAKNEK